MKPLELLPAWARCPGDVGDICPRTSRKPHQHRMPGSEPRAGSAPKQRAPTGSPKPPALPFVAKPTVGNQELVAELLPPVPRFPALPQARSDPVLFFGLGFGVTVWAQALQLCLTFERKRKGPYGSANLASIKDINYAIINRLRYARDWVTGAVPQPVLKDGDVYCPGHRPLHGPVPKPAGLIAEPKPRSPAGPENIPFPSALRPRSVENTFGTCGTKGQSYSRQQEGSRKNFGITVQSPERPSGTRGAGCLWPGLGRAGSACPRLERCSPAGSEEKAPRLLGRARRKHLISWDGGCDATKGLPLMSPQQHTGSGRSPSSVPQDGPARRGAPQITPNADGAQRRSKCDPTRNHHLL